MVEKVQKEAARPYRELSGQSPGLIAYQNRMFKMVFEAHSF